MSGVEVTHVPDQDLVVFAVTGPIDLSELMRVSDEHYAAFPTHHAIWDVRKADSSDLSFEEMRDIYAEQHSLNAPSDGPRAAILVSTDAELAVARLYGAMTEAAGSPVTYRGFLDEAEAMTWLGLAR